MKLLLVLSCVMFTKAGVTKRQAPCDGPVINEVIYTKETLKTGLDRPFLLSIDSTNTLYFSYSVYPNDTICKSAKIDLKTEVFTDIDGLNDGFAQCVDANDNVYIGGNNGVYKYNKVTNVAKLHSAKGVHIWMLFCKHALYYSDSENTYTVVDGKASIYKDLKGNVLFFVIDNDDNMFYANYTGLYRQKKGENDAVYYKDTSNMSIRGLSIDLNGAVYVVVKDGIYVVNKTRNDLKMHFEVDDAFGVAFDDKNNMVYADDLSVHKLRPTRYDECV